MFGFCVFWLYYFLERVRLVAVICNLTKPMNLSGKLLLLLFVCMLCLNVCAQSRWQVGIELQPFGITAPNDKTDSREIDDWYDNSLGFSYKGGITMYRELNRFSWLGAGLAFSQQRYYGLVKFPAIGNRLADTAKMTVRTSDLQIPLRWLIRIASHRVGLVCEPGIVLGFRMELEKSFSESEYTYPRETATNSQLAWPLYWGVNLNLGLSYQFNKGIILMLTPSIELYDVARSKFNAALNTPSTRNYYLRLSFIRTLD